MIRAYRLIDRSDDTETYQYTTACAYWLYGSLVLLIVTTLLQLDMLMYVAWAVFVAYFFIIYIPAFRDAMRIRAAIKESAAEISGSRWSFERPLTIKVRRQDAA